jgi:hypothetical protein
MNPKAQAWRTRIRQRLHTVGLLTQHDVAARSALRAYCFQALRLGRALALWACWHSGEHACVFLASLAWRDRAVCQLQHMMPQGVQWQHAAWYAEAVWVPQHAGRGWPCLGEGVWVERLQLNVRVLLDASVKQRCLLRAAEAWQRSCCLADVVWRMVRRQEDACLGACCFLGGVQLGTKRKQAAACARNAAAWFDARPKGRGARAHLFPSKVVAPKVCSSVEGIGKPAHYGCAGVVGWGCSGVVGWGCTEAVAPAQALGKAVVRAHNPVGSAVEALHKVDVAAYGGQDAQGVEVFDASVRGGVRVQGQPLMLWCSFQTPFCHSARRHFVQLLPL